MKINELKYIIARKDSKIKRLEMENELMRDFLSLTERKWSRRLMLMYGKEASNRKQEIDRQHYTIPNQRPKDKHCGKI